MPTRATAPRSNIHNPCARLSNPRDAKTNALFVLTNTPLAITEDGEVYNPLFRFVSRFLMGYDSTIDTFLRDIAKRVGQSDVVITGA